MIHHPNAGGVLVVSLGCENNQLDAFRELVGPVDESRVKMFVCQKVDDEVAYGVERLKEIYAVASRDVREEVPVSELRVGLKCGGSDGLSGITANPLLGVFSDWIVAQGGTTVLTEVPEMFGAETILMNRCQDEATFDRVREPFAGQQGGRHFHAGGEEPGLHAEVRQEHRPGRAEVCGAPERQGVEPFERAGERPGGIYGPCGFRLPDCAVHYRPWHPVRQLCAHHENLHQYAAL